LIIGLLRILCMLVLPPKPVAMGLGFK
jgi:hypothetical protein